MAERRRARLRATLTAPLRGVERDWTPTRGQLLLTGAVLAAAYALVVTGLAAVFAVGPWTTQALSITTPTILIAACARALRPSLRATAALLGALIGLGVWGFWFVGSGRAGTWGSDPVAVLQQIQHTLLVGSAPLDPAGPLVDVLLFVILLTAVLTSLLFVGLGHPLGAGAMTLVPLLMPTIVTGVPIGWATLLGAGAILALLAWSGSAAPSPMGLLTACTAVAVAAGAVAVAPSTRDRVWNDALLPGPVSESAPDVTIALADDLRERSDARAFTFTATDQGPYRFTLATLADFTGGRWLPQDDTDGDGLTVAEPRSPAGIAPEAEGEAGTTYRAGLSSVTVTIEGLLSSWLPLPQSAARATAGEQASGFDPDQWRWIDASATARADRTITRRGDQYTAEAAQLRSDLDPFGRGASAPESAVRLLSDPESAPEGLAPYLELPDDMPAELSSAAEEVAAGAEDRFAVGMALQEWFRGDGFGYDESAPYEPGMDPDGPYAVMVALLDQRAGFCVHYASTFAVMARELGAPTRVAVGYASRTLGEGETIVRARELHAWPEIYIDDVGWVAFEPTPGGAGVRADTNERVPATPEDSTEGAQSDPRPSPSVEPEPEEDPEELADADAQASDRGPAAAASAALRSALLWGGGTLVVVLLLLPLSLRWLRARARLRRIAAGDRPAQQAWDEFVDTAVDLGLYDAGGATGVPRGAGAAVDAAATAPRARTAEALIDALVSTGALSGDAAAAAGRMADAMAAERYRPAGTAGTPRAAGPAHATSGIDARAELRRVVRGLSAGVSRRAAIRAALLPRSVLRRPTSGGEADLRDHASRVRRARRRATLFE